MYHGRLIGMTNGKQRHIVHSWLRAGKRAQIVNARRDHPGGAAPGLPADQIGYAIDAIFALVAAGFRKAVGIEKKQVAHTQLHVR